MYKIKRFSKSTDKKTNEGKSSIRMSAENLIGYNAAKKGVDLVKSSKSEVTGLHNFYHNTDSPESVMREGIKSKFAEDPNNITNTVLKDVDMSKKKGKVYLGNKKSVSDSVGMCREGNSETLKVEIPYEELKNMKIVDNPELRGAKNSKEFLRKLHKTVVKNGKDKGLDHDLRHSDNKFKKKLGNYLYRKKGDSMYDMLGPKGTTVIEGDIDSRFIKGSEKFQKYGKKDFVRYVKSNPKRFMKGVGKTAVGATAVGGGVYVVGNNMISNYKKNKKK